MNKFFAPLCGLLVVALVGCASVPGIASDIVGAAGTVGAVAQAATPVDFRSGEVLCSEGADSDPEEMNYSVATVITAPSTATKNQAQVLFVSNGEKGWSSFVVPSHKAAKSELAVGKLVFCPRGYSDTDLRDVDAEGYRHGQWALVRITNVDELFKNRIEVNGARYDPGLIRIPDIALE